MFEFSGNIVKRMDSYQKNDKTERARGLGRKTREEIGKGNQITTPRFQTGGGNSTRHQRRPFGNTKWPPISSAAIIYSKEGNHDSVTNSH